VTWHDERNTLVRFGHSSIYFNYFFVDGLVNLNDSVNVHPIESTYSTTSEITDCPDGFVGKFRFDVEIENKSNGLLSDLVIQVAKLTDRNLLKVAEGVPGARGQP